MRDEFLDPTATSDIEEIVEAGLRPRHLAEFVGQRELKEHLEIVLEAARRRGQSVDHLLFAGPPGLGKTTLAYILAALLLAGTAVSCIPQQVPERCDDNSPMPWRWCQ